MQVLPNRRPDGTEVEITESTDRFSEFRLSDGTVLRAKPSITQAIRLPDHWDSEGNPTYSITSQLVVFVASAPDELKRKH